MFAKESQPSTSSSMEFSQPCRRFDFPEILLATNNFDESLVIGHGGFGKVYKGKVFNGSSFTISAIKRLDSLSTQGETEFWAEVEMLSTLRHCHLVSLFGYCNHEKEMILIYEYMPYRTLEDHLHKLGNPLSWLQRLKICIGAARGLDYLHTGTGIEFGVIHRDVKSSNILLNEVWAAKISDFGLSKIGPTNQPSTYVNTLVKGTFGYLDPNYFTTGRLTRKSDVYAFGVVLLEVLCRKRAVDRTLDEDQWGLVTWVQDSIKQGNLKHIIDDDITDQISAKCLKEFVRIAERCLHNNPKQRPTMAEVVVGLDYVLTLQQKIDTSLQSSVRTIFGRMLDKFPFPSNGDNSADIANTDQTNPNPSLKVFKFTNLKRATRNFSQDLLLGYDDFGEVYLGWVDKNTFAPSKDGVGNGIGITVKWHSQDQPEWQTVVTVLGWLVHPNIIRLLGYCNDEQHGHLLVYEYVQNKNLDQSLFGDAFEPLSWGIRLKIMIGVARGLVYMHSSKDQFKFIRRDIKISNILLDQDFNAKLGGFGLAEYDPYMEEKDVGTLGYVDPWYIRNGYFSLKSDIYSFGVVLLETLTGRQLSEMNEIRLVEWAILFLTDRNELKKIIDPRLEMSYPLEGAFEWGTLALRCVAKIHKDMPSSEEVLRSLEVIDYFYK